MNTYRQGDVLIIRCTEPVQPDKPVAREGGRVVLVRGVSTGHSHAVESPDAELFTIKGHDGLDKLLRVKGEQSVGLAHDEHSTIEIPPGDYIVRRQREYTPEALRTVED